MVEIELINPHKPHHFYVGVIIATFGFRFVWPFFPRMGVAITGVGLAIATDDFITHTTGIDTVGDWIEYRMYDVAKRLRLIK